MHANKHYYKEMYAKHGVNDIDFYLASLTHSTGEYTALCAAVVLCIPFVLYANVVNKINKMLF